MKIVVVGSSNTDMIIHVPRIPKPGETILGGAFSIAAGGKGANQAVAAARAGGKVTLIARVGNDIFGRRAVQGFKKDGLNVRHVIKDGSSPSGIALIFVAADGENSIAVASGANSRLSPEDVLAARETIEAAQIIVTQLETPLETVRAVARTASRKKIPFILNPAPAGRLDDALLKRIAFLTPNETEAELLTGVRVADDAGIKKAAGILLAKGVRTVIITLGPRGAYVHSDRFSGFVPGFKVKAVDATAAGDVFNGALAVSLAEGEKLDQAVRFANAAAALSVTKPGAQPSSPRRAEIEDLLAKGEAAEE
jgi:ribokinase